jgi:hypothetical protein
VFKFEALAQACEMQAASPEQALLEKQAVSCVQQLPSTQASQLALPV